MAATGSHLPGEPITNEQVERFAGGVPEDVLDGLQVKTRHWLADPASGEQSDSNSGMAAKAARQALQRAAIDPADVQLLVVSTSSPEYHLPASVVFVQDELGLQKCATMEMRGGCAGVIGALDLARMYLERGRYDNAVVIGVEAISPLLVGVWADGPDRVRLRDRLGIYSFGDGAGAMVLTAHDGGGDTIMGSAIACIGGGRKPGMQVVGGGTHAPFAQQRQAKRPVEMKVDVVESGRFTPHVLTEGLRATLAAAGVAADDIAHCIIPEGNAPYMTEELRAAGLLTDEWLTLEPRIYENLADVGATGSAAVPLAVDTGWTTGRLQPGETIMLLAIETSKWIYGGMVLPWTASPPAA